jgi:FtsH-binding integral membrane protein
MSESNFLSKVFLWMFIGLMVTFCTGVTVSNSVTALEFVFSTGGYWFLVIAEFVTVLVLSARINKMSPTGAKIGFVFYSFLTGLTFSSVFIVFKVSSIIAVFLITSLIMLIFAIIGAKTKIDLTKFGTYLLMILVGIVIASIIAMFVQSEAFNLVLCIISIIIFIIYIAYDVQHIIKLYTYDQYNENLAIYGALQLYLDFINIFLDLLRLFGDNNN